MLVSELGVTSGCNDFSCFWFGVVCRCRMVGLCTKLMADFSSLDSISAFCQLLLFSSYTAGWCIAYCLVLASTLSSHS